MNVEIVNVETVNVEIVKTNRNGEDEGHNAKEDMKADAKGVYLA